MEEYIVKKDTIDLLKNIGAPQYAINAVDVLAKPVEFVPLRHAYWEKMPSNGIGGTGKCSECGKSIYGYIAMKYCPNCGAKMDGNVNG